MRVSYAIDNQVPLGFDEPSKAKCPPGFAPGLAVSLVPDDMLAETHDVLDDFRNLHIDFSDVKFLWQIGRGSTCRVYSGVFHDAKVAIKCFTPKNLTTKFLSNFAREVGLLRALRHRNLCTFYGILINPPHLCLVFELCEWGPLTNHVAAVAAWDWATKLAFFMEVAGSVVHIHGLDPPVAHRDIKPDNFLVRNDGR